MPLSFVAYNKLHRDTHLAVPDTQVEPSFSQKKIKIKNESKGEETGKWFKEFQYFPYVKICLHVADTGYVCFEEQVKLSKTFETAASIGKSHKLSALGEFFLDLEGDKCAAKSHLTSNTL